MKEFKKLNSYRGRLSSAEIAEGMNFATTNARRLAEDADILLTSGRFPTAASLACLSIEESGKVSILRQLATATSDDEVKTAWKSYRSHTRKNVQWLLPQLAMQGARKLDDLRPLFDENSNHPHDLDHLKQLGFYTDCLGNRQWSIPTSVIDEELSRMLVWTAKLLVSKKEISIQEIDLWILHVGPAPKNDLPQMKQALMNWYSAMQEAGLKPQGINEMERFINEGVPFPKGIYA